MAISEKVLVTGAAGFIGFHLTRKLISLGYKVTGIDNINDYYDVNLKKSRLEVLSADPNFVFRAVDLTNKKDIDALFREHQFPYVVNLAAQAGVRYSLINPYAYLE